VRVKIRRTRKLLRAKSSTAEGHDVLVLTRSPRGERQVHWDGSTLGGWAGQIDGSDVVVNLASRSVNCRYTNENLEAMMTSRVESARVVGRRDPGTGGNAGHPQGGRKRLIWDVPEHGHAPGADLRAASTLPAAG
jgi:hypothetical protein